MSSTGFLEETLTRHAIYVERYAGGRHRDLQPLLNRLSKDIRALITSDLTSFEAARRRSVLSQINALITGTMDEYDTQFVEHMQEFAEYEAGFNLNATQQVMSVQLAAIAPERIEAMLTQATMTLVSGQKVQEFTIDSMLANFRQAIGDETDSQIRSIINAGVANGDNVTTITNRVARNVSASINSGKVNQWARSNVLTAAKHISQEAMRETVRANSDLFNEEVFSATLDKRTSLLCSGLDQSVHKVGEGPYPALHYRCRSIRIPRIKPEYAIIRESTRASMDGPVDSRTTYQSWLRRQSNEFQDDVLGPERAELFRSGKVKLDKFVDDQGRTLTLSELREREGLTLA